MEEIKTIHVEINEDGTTSNGSIFSAVDHRKFYLDHINYTIKKGRLIVTGYDKTNFKGTANIASSITYKGKTYEVLEVGDHAFSSCGSLTSIDIPSSVTSIGDHAFAWCYTLTSVTIPTSVTSIGDSAFSCCNFTSIDIPSSVTSIGSCAFERCDSLTSIVIPESVTSIGSYAFRDCLKLTTVVCRAENVPKLDDRSFTNVPKSEATLYVPASALEAYKAADQWKDFGTILPIEG